VVLASANPVRWIRRYPVKCGIATSLLIAASAAGVVLALRRKKNRDASGPANPVNVYLKNPQNSHHWRFQLASALLAGVAGKLSQGIKARFIESLTEHRAPTRSQTVIVPNPKLRDVEI